MDEHPFNFDNIIFHGNQGAATNRPALKPRDQESAFWHRNQRWIEIADVRRRCIVPVADFFDKSLQQRLGFGSTGIFGGNTNRHTSEGVNSPESSLERPPLQGSIG